MAEQSGSDVLISTSRGCVRRSQSGQTLLEVALLTPVLLALLVGTIEFGRYAYLSILVGNAARAGAAYGAATLEQSGETSNIQTAAQNDFANNGQPAGNLTVTSVVSCGCDNGGTITYQGTTTAACTTAGNPSLDTSCAGGGHYIVIVSVTATGSFSSIFQYPGIPKTMSITSTAAMRVAND